MRAKSSLPVTVLKQERNVPRHLAHEPEEEEVVLRGSCGQWHDLTMPCVGLTAPVWVQDSRDDRAASPTLTPLLTQDVRLHLLALDLCCLHQSEAVRSTGQGLLIDDSQKQNFHSWSAQGEGELCAADINFLSPIHVPQNCGFFPVLHLNLYI